MEPKTSKLGPPDRKAIKMKERRGSFVKEKNSEVEERHKVGLTLQGEPGARRHVSVAGGEGKNRCRGLGGWVASRLLSGSLRGPSGSRGPTQP